MIRISGLYNFFFILMNDKLLQVCYFKFKLEAKWTLNRSSVEFKLMVMTLFFNFIFLLLDTMIKRSIILT